MQMLPAQPLKPVLCAVKQVDPRWAIPTVQLLAQHLKPVILAVQPQVVLRDINGQTLPKQFITRNRDIMRMYRKVDE